jgi:preprotein translocase subunit SecA
MTDDKKDFPDLPELPELPGMHDIPEDSPEYLAKLEESVNAIPEPPPEPKIAPLPFVPEAKIVEKMQSLIQQKKDEAAERERLASMPKQPYRRDEPRVGRNDPCPCGSGKKYKKCHMGKDEQDGQDN